MQHKSLALLFNFAMRLTIISGAATIFLIGAPLLVEAIQIAPNPNPVGSTIDIINDPFAVNNANPFLNIGTITIDSTSTLTNTGTIGGLGGEFSIGNSGTVINTGSMNLSSYGQGAGQTINNGTLAP